eukprot:CAMPEP_0172717490 /NCGR_PEP_ID=MMETSP1074-20121228/71562_1 /TAXON_ID=2916 /ORGANISM="Ceratium fusus, Strain PA161109" /LENGTH=230 /DNA_ID=CAMNT_0013542433 /DNA_START=63 /DNA_END=753 /DNA_ORIENTATION=+
MSRSRSRGDGRTNGDHDRIQRLVDERQQCRRDRDFDKADAMREELRSMGVNVNDAELSWRGPDGSGGTVTSSGGFGGIQRRDGDWDCPSCGKMVFASKDDALHVEHPNLVAKVAGATATVATDVVTAAVAVTMTAAGSVPMTAMMIAEVIAMAIAMMTVASGMIVILTAAIGMPTAVIATTQTVMTDTATATMTGGAAAATTDAVMITAIDDRTVNLQQQARELSPADRW